MRTKLETLWLESTIGWKGIPVNKLSEPLLLDHIVYILKFTISIKNVVHCMLLTNNAHDHRMLHIHDYLCFSENIIFIKYM